MNYFVKYRFAIWAIVILLVMVVTATVTVFYSNYSFNKDRDQREDRRRQERQAIWDELKLSPEQKTQFDTLRSCFFRSSRPIFDSLESKRLKMIAEMSKPNPDTTVLNTLSDEVGDFHKALKRNSIKHILSLRSVCNSGQMEAMNKIIPQLLRPEGPPRRHNKGDKKHDDDKKPRD